MKFRRAIVHIGPDKTGSTAIQLAFQHHQALLAEQGVLFPLGQWHAQLGSHFASRPEDFIYNVLSRRSNAEVRSQEDAAWMARFVEALETGPHDQLFVSYEGLTDLDVDGMRRLAAFLCERAERVDVLAYCRDPLAYAVSSASQHLKSGIRPWTSRLHSPYRDMFERVRAGFGTDALAVRRFDRRTMRRGNVICDVLDFLGMPLDLTDRFVGGVPDRNPALSEEAFLIGERLVEIVADRIGNGGDFNGRLVEALESIAGRPAKLPAAVLPLVMQAAQPHMAYVAQEFGIVFDSPEANAAPDAVPALAPDTAASMARMIVASRLPMAARVMQSEETDVTVTSAVSRYGETVRCGEVICFDVEILLDRDVSELVAGIHIRDEHWDLAFGTNTRLLPGSRRTLRSGRHRFSYLVNAALPAGSYAVGFAFSEVIDGKFLDLSWHDRLCDIRVEHSTPRSNVGYADLPAAIVHAGVMREPEAAWRSEGTAG